MNELPIHGPDGRTLVSAQTRKASDEWDGETDGSLEIEITVDSDADGRDDVQMTIDGTVYSILLADLLGALGKELDK